MLVVLRPETKIIFILRPINENVSTRLNHFSEQMNLLMENGMWKYQVDHKGIYTSYYSAGVVTVERLTFFNSMKAAERGSSFCLRANSG